MKPFPDKKYNTLVIDPPWDISMAGAITKRRPNQAKKLPYETMSLEEICELPIHEIANIGAHIYLWTTNKMLEQSFSVLKRWGVNFHQVLVSAKHNGMCPCFGYKFATEFCVLGFFGKPMQKFLRVGKLNWIKVNMCKKHSAKPSEFYSLFEEMSPEPRIDIFAREHKEGWDVWGDEIKKYEMGLFNQ